MQVEGSLHPAAIRGELLVNELDRTPTYIKLNEEAVQMPTVHLDLLTSRAEGESLPTNIIPLH